MTFEEDFPSLEKYRFSHCWGCEGDDCKLIDEEHIEKFCLDKEKVREVLDAPPELASRLDSKEEIIKKNERFKERRRIKKLLGLEASDDKEHS